MQPSFTPHQTPSAGGHGWSPVASGVTLLHTAYHWWTGTTMGTLPAQADSRADHAAPPARLGADIAALLDMPRETDAADFEAARPKRDRTSPQDRKGSLDTQQALVRHWLAKPHMLTRLADLGLSVGDVEASVLRNIANFEAGLPVRVMAGAHTGLVTYPQRPRAHDLFAYSVRDAMQRSALLQFRAAGLPTTAPPGRPDAAPEPVPGVDQAQREGAVMRVRQFRTNVERMLPHFGAPFPEGFWSLAEGRAVLADLSFAIDSVPCATSLHPVRNGFGAVYPSPGDDSLRMHHVTVERRGEVLLSRTADGHHVRYSFDKGRSWTDTAFYTDDVVEAEKAQLWGSIVRMNKDAKRRHILAARWMRW